MNSLGVDGMLMGLMLTTWNMINYQTTCPLRKNDFTSYNRQLMLLALHLVVRSCEISLSLFTDKLV